MKTTLVAVTTLNGFIADTTGSYPWASDADREEFHKLYKESGCIIIGRRTYDILRERDTFPTPGRKVVVVTHEKSMSSKNQNIVFADSPKAALEYLNTRGFNHALLGGGGILNTSFMKAGLVDEVILTVEPVIIGRGTPLFASGDFFSSLILKSCRNLNPGTLQLTFGTYPDKHSRNLA